MTVINVFGILGAIEYIVNLLVINAILQQQSRPTTFSCLTYNTHLFTGSLLIGHITLGEEFFKYLL